MYHFFHIVNQLNRFQLVVKMGVFTVATYALNFTFMFYVFGSFWQISVEVTKQIKDSIKSCESQEMLCITLILLWLRVPSNKDS